MYLNLRHVGKKLGVDKAADSFAHQGLTYLDRYAQHFNNLAYRPINLLEIGVDQGKSLKMWKECLPCAKLWGIDTNPKVKDLPCNEWATIRVGSQDNPTFLKELAEEAGGFGLVIDDGSHIAAHMKTSFDALWPFVDEDGWYAIEDLLMTYSKDWTETQAEWGRDPNHLANLPKQSRQPIMELLADITSRLDYRQDVAELHHYAMMMLIRQVRDGV